MDVKLIRLATVALIPLLVLSTAQAFNHTSVGHGADTCLMCHGGEGAVHGKDMSDYYATRHPWKVQGPPTQDATPVLRTTIDGEEVSIFDPRTEGYETYVAPWADYFNEENVVYTIGSFWKQRFMTQVVPETVDGQNYSGFVTLEGNDYVVMGIQWNPKFKRWQDYQGPTGANNWYSLGRLTRKKCGGCHTTGFDPDSGEWADKHGSMMQKGVSCESCHRPAVGGDVIRNPEALPFKQRLELCGACHGRGTSIGPDGVSAGQYGFPYSEKLGRGYGPTDDLADFYIQTSGPGSFWQNGSDGGDGNSKKHHQQYLDLLQSEHVEHEIGCMDCHDAHETKNEHQIRKEGNALCLMCHTEYADANSPDGVDVYAYRMHSAHDPSVAKCSHCHMPKTAKSINAFDIHSHTFKIIEPATTVAMGGDPNGFSGPLDPAHLPNSCNSRCHNGVGAGPLKTNEVAQKGLIYIKMLHGEIPSCEVDGE